MRLPQPEGGKRLSDSKEGTRPQDIRVIDRRKFAPDGTPRDAGTAAEDFHAADPVPAFHPPASAPAPASPEAPTGPAPTGREVQQAAAQFRSLVLNLATTAAANLGEIPNPFTQQTEIDIEGARQVIDLIRALQIKTRGNLNTEESGLLESLLYDLRAKFLSLQTRAAKKP